MTHEEKNQASDEIKNQPESDSEQSTPLIKPGYDYIWGSDQDDLTEDKEEV